MIDIKQKKLFRKLVRSEFIIAFLISLIIWTIFFTFTGLLFSGFHLIDDHEIAVMNSDLHSMNFFDVLHKWLMVDRSVSRFRPAYYIHRVFQARVFGLSWTLWFAYGCLQASITTAGLFIFTRSLQFTRVEAALFAGLSVFGYQAITWWRLAPAETTAMPFLAIALACAALSLNDKRKQRLLNVVFVLSTLFASLCKESFVLFIPAICLVRAWTIWRTNPKPSLTQVLRHREILPCYLLLLICVLEILLIKFTVGTGGIGYAGIDTTAFNINRIILVFSVLAQRGNLLFAFVSLGTFCVLILLQRRFDHSRNVTIDRSLLVGLVFLLTVPLQVWLYTKSGLDQHYLFPAIIACSLLNVQALALYRQNRLKWLTGLLTAILSFLLLQNVYLTWNAFHEFALEGQGTTALFRNLESCTQQESPVLVIANPRIHYELSYSIKRYLTYVFDRKNLVVSTYGGEGTDFKSNAFPEEVAWNFIDPKSIKQLYDSRSLDSIAVKSDIDAIVVFPKLKDDFLNSSQDWFQPNQYQQSEHELNYIGGTILLYCKK